MLKKILIAAATGAALMGAVAPSYADYVAPNGTYVRTYPRRVIVQRPVYARTYYGERHRHRGYHRGGFHRVWHHGRPYWERW